MRPDRFVHRFGDHHSRHRSINAASWASALLAASITWTAWAQSAPPPASPSDPAVQQAVPSGEAAQPVVDSPAPPPTLTPTSAEDHAKLVRIAADRLARSALLFVRSLENPTPEDFRTVALTLQEVVALEPDDGELERLLLESWHAAGDEAQVIQSTRRLIRLDPHDTVAQLRLLSNRIGALQSVEARQQVYDRLLDQGASQLDVSIRSRLALDAALLAREIGDDDQFVDRLTLATQLDSTNKPAAMLAATFALQRLTNPIARVEMLANVVLADPLDPTTHFGLAEELFSQGAYKSAKRFYTNTSSLRRSTGSASSVDLSQRLLFCTWAINGSQYLIDLLTNSEQNARLNIKRQKEAAQLAGDDPNQIPSYQPNPTSESLRLAAAIALGDSIESQAALDRLKLITSAIIDALQKAPDPANENASPQDQDPDQIAASVLNWRLNLLWFRLWSGLELDKAQQTIDSLKPEEAAGLIASDTMQKYRGLLAAQRGDRDSADKMLEPLTDEQARVSLGIAAERAGDQSQAIKRYASVALDFPDSLFGIWSRTRIQTLLGKQLELTPASKVLNEYCDSLPNEIDALVKEPRSLLHIEVQQATKTIDPMDRLSVRIAIRNVSPIPLALGPNAPISSNLLLSPRFTIGSKEITTQLKPEVISFNRRLRLRPGQSIEATVWAGQGQVGALNDQALLNAALIRWRLVSGFTVTSDGQYMQSALSLTAESNVARRTPLAPPQGGLNQIPELIRKSQGVDLIRLVTIAPAAVQYVQQQVNPEAATTFFDSIIEALSDRLPTMNRFERAMLVQLLPATSSAEHLKPIEETLRNDPDRLVRLLFLYQRARDPNDPIYALAQAGDDPIVAEIAAQLYRHVLELVSDPSKTPPKVSSTAKQR